MIILLLRLALAGQISVLNYSIDYLNIGLTQTLSITFRLESGLGQGYLSLKLPMTLQQSLTGTTPNGVSVTYNQVSSLDCSPISQFPGSIAFQSSYYHIRFLDLNLNPQSLTAGQYYRVIITSTAPFVSEIAQINAPIEMMTIQDYTQTNWMVYDRNRVAAVLEFTAAPPTTLQATVIGTPSTVLGALYSLQLSITPTLPILGNARIVVKMLDSSYQFQGQQCTSQAFNITTTNGTNITTTTISAVTLNTQYVCTISNNILTVTLNQSFTSALQFSFSMLNPKYVKSLGGGFLIQSMNSTSNNVIEQISIPSILSTTQIAWGSLRTLFSWGLPLNRSVYNPSTNILITLPSPIGILMSTATDPFYNTFRFTFSPATNTPYNLALKVVLSLQSVASYSYLEGSIQENLPPFDFNPISCTLDGTPQVYCVNVGTLTAGETYFIGIKGMFIGAAQSLSSNFGMITVYSLNSAGYDATPLIAAARDPLGVYTTSVYTSITYVTAGNTNANMLVHSQSSAAAMTAVTNSAFGVQLMPSTNQRLIFTCSMTSGQFGSTFPVGVDIYTSPNISPQGSTFIAETLALSPLPLAPIISSNTVVPYTRIQLGVSSGAEVSSTFVGTPAQWAVGPITIGGTAGQFVTQSLIDFFGSTANSVLTTPTYTTPFAANSYTVSPNGQFSAVVLTMVNFWTGTASSLDGTKFPAFIRLQGTFTQLETVGVSRIAIFFTNLQTFDTSTSPEGKTYASCSSTLQSKQQCIRYYGNDNARNSLYHMSRIEFYIQASLLGPASPFQLLIPVKTITNKGSIFLQAATIATSTDGKIYSTFQKVKSTFYSKSFTPTATMTVSGTLSALNYAIDLSAQPQVGSANSAAIIFYQHSDSGTTVTANSGTNQGAGFFYQSTYQMVGQEFSAASVNMPSYPTYSGRCISYSYLNNYGFWCPFYQGVIGTTSNSKLTISGYNYNKASISFLSTWAGWSNNQGQLVSFYQDPQVTTLRAGTLSFQSTTVLQGLNDQVLTWKFTTSNTLQNILITFAASSTWPFSVDQTAKCTLVGSSAIAHTCSVISISNVSLKFVITSTLPFVADSYSLTQYGVTMPNVAGSTLSLTFSTTTAAGVTIDSTNNNAGQVLFAMPTTIANIKITKLAFDFTNSGVRNSFSMTFTISGRLILYRHQLIINLSMLSANTQSNCILSSGGSVSFDFNSIQNTAYVFTLTPVGDINPKTYTFQCFNVIAPTVYTAPTVKVQTAAAGLIMQSDNTTPTFTFTTMPPTFTALTLSKQLLQAGAILTLTLNVTIPFAFNSSSTLYVNLPYYYNSYDNQNSLSCQISGTSAFCSYFSQRTISVQLFTTTITANTLFTVVITGIAQPSQTYSPDMIYVMFDNDATPTNLTLMSTIADVAPSSSDISQASLIVGNFTISTSIIRATSVYTYSLFNLIAFAVGDALYIDFSSVDYGHILELQTPSGCSLSQNLTEYSSSCTAVGARLIMNVTTAIPINTNLTLTLQGMTNLEASSCSVGTPWFSHVNSDRSTILARSAINRANIAPFKFATDNSLYYTYWFQEVGQYINYQIMSIQDPQIVRLNYVTLQMVPGQYSGLISLGQIGKGFNKQINITLLTPQFSSISSMRIYPGDGKMVTRFGCSGTTNPQNFYLQFGKAEDGSDVTYSNIGILAVQVINQISPVSTQFSTYTVPVMGSSIPIIFDFTAYIPFDVLIVSLTLVPPFADDPPGLVFASSSSSTISIQINTTNFVQSVTVISQTNITTITTNHTAQLQMSFSGSSAAYYAQYPGTTINLIPNTNSSTVQFNLTFTELSISATNQTFNISASDDVTVYYHVSLLNQIQRNLTYVQAQIQALHVLLYSDYNQEQFGLVSAVLKSQFTVTYLKARTWYWISAWAVDKYGNINQSSYQQFVTQNNEGRMMKLTFVFGQTPTVAQKKAIACWMCYSFAYPCVNVLSFDAISCTSAIANSLSYNSTAYKTPYRMMATNTSNTTNSTTATNTTTSTSTNTSNSSTTTTNTTSNSTAVPSSTILQAQNISFYFIPNRELTLDTNWQQISAALSDSNFFTYFTGNLTNGTRIMSHYPLQELVFTNTPSIISTIAFTRGTTWLYLSNILLQDDGLVWMYITPMFNGSSYSLNSSKPTATQIKFMANNLNQSVNVVIIPYLKSQQAIGYNFTGLQRAKWYQIYAIATRDDPSLWSMTSSVYNYQNKTLRDTFTAPTTQYAAILCILISLLF